MMCSGHGSCVYPLIDGRRSRSAARKGEADYESMFAKAADQGMLDFETEFIELHSSARSASSIRSDDAADQAAETSSKIAETSDETAANDIDIVSESGTPESSTPASAPAASGSDASGPAAPALSSAAPAASDHGSSGTADSQSPTSTAVSTTAPAASTVQEGDSHTVTFDPYEAARTLYCRCEEGWIGSACNAKVGYAAPIFVDIYMDKRSMRGKVKEMLEIFSTQLLHPLALALADALGVPQESVAMINAWIKGKEASPKPKPPHYFKFEPPKPADFLPRPEAGSATGERFRSIRPGIHASTLQMQSADDVADDGTSSLLQINSGTRRGLRSSLSRASIGTGMRAALAHAKPVDLNMLDWQIHIRARVRVYRVSELELVRGQLTSSALDLMVALFLRKFAKHLADDIRVAVRCETDSYQQALAELMMALEGATGATGAASGPATIAEGDVKDTSEEAVAAWKKGPSGASGPEEKLFRSKKFFEHVPDAMSGPDWTDGASIEPSGPSGATGVSGPAVPMQPAADASAGAGAGAGTDTTSISTEVADLGAGAASGASLAAGPGAPSEADGDQSLPKFRTRNGPSGCSNHCSGNGLCMRGRCYCSPGFVGVDCAQPSDSLVTVAAQNHQYGASLHTAFLSSWRWIFVAFISAFAVGWSAAPLRKRCRRRKKLQGRI